MKNPLECSSYRFANRNEYCLRIGSEHKTQILLIPPLFDEMNRMRRMIVDTMRLLADHNLGVVLPDLPGTNESLLPQKDASLVIWRDALLSCLNSHPECSFVAAMRGGCLVDDFVGDLPKWRLTPVKGTNLLRTMMRTKIGSDKESGKITTIADLTEQAQSEPIELAGNLISPKLFAQLQKADAASTDQLRTIRLETDSKTADDRIAGNPLWLRAEPDADMVLSHSIADDIANWVRS